MREFIPPDICDPEVVYGIISGFPIHDSYPINNRDELDMLFRDDYYAWEAMSEAAVRTGIVSASDDPEPTVERCVYGVDGSWEYNGKQIIDRGFILFGGSTSSLRDFMERYRRPYVLKSDGQIETVSLFSSQNGAKTSIYVGDLDTWSEVLRRVYSHLRADTIFGKYTPVTVEQTVRRTTNDLIFDFLTHLRQNGEIDLIGQNSIAINDERARREIKLLDHPRLKNLGTNNRPTFAGVLKMIMSEPRPPPTLIQATEASEYLRETVRVQGTVTEIETNRRGDVLLRFYSPEKIFTAIIPIFSGLVTEREWISSLKDQTVIVNGLISIYFQKPAMRILEKNQIVLPEPV